MLYVPLDSSFISTQFFLLYIIILTLISSIICYLFSGDIYLSFGISDSFSFCEGNSLEDFEALVILSEIHYQLNHQFVLLFFEFLSLKQLLLHLR